MKFLAFLLAFSAGAIACAAPTTRPSRIYTFDMTDLYAFDRKDPAQARRAWDTAHLVASIQGIVNRDEPRLFVRFMKETDDFWWSQLREKGNWLADANVVQLASIDDLLKTFQPQIKGIVAYREEVRATSNLASTIAGVEDRICLRFDESSESVYQHIVSLNLGLDILRLYKPDGSPLFIGRGTIPDTNVSSTGSAKCDAYLWAKSRYINTNRCSTDYMAYYIDTWWLKFPQLCALDNFTLSNHDFFIAQRAFFFDLNTWEDETPIDDRDQQPGTDLRTLRTILRAMHDRAAGKILNIGGFVPWAWKYTNHGQAGGKHGDVETEWKYAQVISSYNGIMDADAIGLCGMANASFYQHFPLNDRYPQNRKPTIDDLKRQNLIRVDGSVAPYFYVLFYMGDYDSAAWLNQHVPRIWKDPNRGTIPCAWAINPNLDRRAPHVMHYVRTHASPNDWFIAGDSGAGYLNPGMLFAPRLDPDLPEASEAWVKHCLPYYRRYDLSITGFIIDGRSQAMGQKGLDAYMRFSPDGIVAQKIPPRGLHRGTMPYIQMRTDLDGSPQKAGQTIAAVVGTDLPSFAPIRTILKAPTWHKQTMAAATASPNGEKIRFVDPYTFFLLLKTHEQNRAN